MEHRHYLQKPRHSSQKPRHSLKNYVIPAQAGTQLRFKMHETTSLKKSLSGVGLPPTRE